MRKQVVKALVEKYGYVNAKRKMRIKGYTKKEILNFTDFLFT